MRRPASPSRAGQALRSAEPGLKDAVRRLRRSPAAILDAGLSAARSKATAGTTPRMPSHRRASLPRFSSCRTSAIVIGMTEG